MSINKLISIRNPIINAIDLLGLDHVQDMPIFTTWAIDAENKIGSYYQWVRKRVVLDIHNCTVCLPADAKSIQKAILGDVGCACDDLTSSRCDLLFNNTGTFVNSNTSGSFLIVDLGSDFEDFIGSVPYTIQDNKLLLNQCLDGQKITVQYLGYKTDCDGFLEIGQNHVDAIKWYIIWLYWYRKRNLSPMEQGKMNTARQEWERNCANARATDSEPSESEKLEMNAMLHDPLVGYGLNLGMNTTLGVGFW
jgi:hypothetical protein